MNKKFRLVALLLAMVFVLAACGGNETPPATPDAENAGEETTPDESGEKEPGTTEAPEFETTVTNEGDPIEGGTLRIGIASDSAFPGVFNWMLYDNNLDSLVMTPILGGDMSTGENFTIGDGGPLYVEFDPENKKTTVTIDEKYTWSDGRPVTAEDYEYAFYFVGHPDYPGIRYDYTYKNIVGMEEYHNGETDTISGITCPDDHTVVIEYSDYGVGALWGEGLAYNVLPKKEILEALETTPMAEMKEADVTRKNVPSAGPFVISEVVPGESVVAVPNEYYWKGVPKVDKLVIEVTGTSTVVAALKAGKYDIMDIPTDVYLEASELDNIDILGQFDLTYSYIGFQLGEFKDGEVIPDPDKKMANQSLRQAMGYAYDMDAVNENFYHGLRPRANSLIVPPFSFHNPDLEGYYYNPEKAMELLDEAGYVDVDDDGFREDPNGEPLVINFLSMSGGEIAEPMAQYFIQCWEEIGLNVQLNDDRLWDMNAFYDKVQNDDPSVDVFQGAWGTGTNPDPSGLYGNDAAFNLQRYTDDKLQDALDRIGSKESFDEEFQKQAYKDFEDHMFELATAIPINYRYVLTAVNKRVSHYDINYITDFDICEIELLADEPIKAE